jgi:hypothetical protein
MRNVTTEKSEVQMPQVDGHQPDAPRVGQLVAVLIELMQLH